MFVSCLAVWTGTPVCVLLCCKRVLTSVANTHCSICSGMMNTGWYRLSFAKLRGGTMMDESHFLLLEREREGWYCGNNTDVQKYLVKVCEHTTDQIRDDKHAAIRLHTTEQITGRKHTHRKHGQVLTGQTCSCPGAAPPSPGYSQPFCF